MIEAAYRALKVSLASISQLAVVVVHRGGWRKQTAAQLVNFVSLQRVQDEDAIANGAAPTPEGITVRELIRQFGYQKRGDYINSYIRNGLEKFDLIADQDFAIGWIDSTITIRLDLDVPDVPKPDSTSDPTHRIRIPRGSQ